MKTLLVTEDPGIQRRFDTVLGDANSARPAVCATAEAAEIYLSQNRDTQLLVVDFTLAALGGLKVVERLMKSRKALAVILLIPPHSNEIARQALALGVSATAPTSLSQKALSHVLALIREGHNLMLLPRFGTRQQGAAHTLSRRELQILALLCDGQQNKEIAHAFGIQEVTVKMHMRAVIRKLGARNRTHAAMIARDQGLV